MITRVVLKKIEKKRNKCVGGRGAARAGGEREREREGMDGKSKASDGAGRWGGVR